VVFFADFPGRMFWNSTIPLQGRGGRAFLRLLPVLFAWGCAAPPYQPALLFLPGMEGRKALQASVEPVHTFFPRVKVLKENLLLTDWTPLKGLPYPCRARAEIVARPVEGGTLLEIAVQRCRLGTALFTGPAWVDDGGDRALEERLLRVLEAQLGGREVRPGELPRRRPGSPGSG